MNLTAKFLRNESLLARGSPYRFDEELKRTIARRLADHVRQPGDGVGLKRAAVAICIARAPDAPEAVLLLTERAANLRAHRGQWALPGGRCDEGEEPGGTALRELEEEIGLSIGPENLLGMLDDYPTRSGYLITPVVVWAAAAGIRLNPAEVAALHRVPLELITDADAFEFLTQTDSHRLIVRMKLWGDHLHAPAAAMVYQFREVALLGRKTRVADLDQTEFARR